MDTKESFKQFVEGLEQSDLVELIRDMVDEGALSDEWIKELMDRQEKCKTKVINALIFVGGEQADAETDTIELPDWTEASALKAIREYRGVRWSLGKATWLEGCPSMVDTIQVVNNNLIQAGDDPDDGGMIYIVRA